MILAAASMADGQERPPQVLRRTQAGGNPRLPGSVPFSLPTLRSSTLVIDATFVSFPLPPSPLLRTPLDLTLGPDGSIWFLASDLIGKITNQGNLSLYDNTFANGLTTGDDGLLWYILRYPRFAAIASRSITGAPIHQFPFADSPPPDLGDLAYGPDNALWFTLPERGQIGRLRSPDGTREYFTHPLGLTRRPQGILRAENHFVVLSGIVDEGLDEHEVSGVSTTGDFTLIARLESATHSGWALSSSGDLWLTHLDIFGGNYLIRVQTDGTQTRYPVPWDLSAVTVSPNGTVWFASAGNGVGSLAVDGSLMLYAAPVLTSDTFSIIWGPDDHLWFGAQQAIVRMDLPTVPVTLQKLTAE